MIFDNFREGLADTTLDWVSDDIRAILFLAATWAPDPSDVFVDDAVTAGAIEAATTGDRQALASTAVNLDPTTHKMWFEADGPTYPGVADGTPFDTLVIFKFVSDDTDSLLLLSFGLGAQSGDGNDIDIDPEDGTIYAKL